MPRKGRIVGCVTLAGHARVVALAQARQISVSQLICRAINALLLEEGDETEFLEECLPGRQPAYLGDDADEMV